MKRLIIAITFFLIAIIICTTGYILCLEKLNDMNNSLGKAVYVANQEDKCKLTKETDKLIKKWNKYEHILGLFISHNEIKDIEDNIRILPYYAEVSDYSQYEEICNRGIISSKHIIQSHRLILKNIF